MAPSFTATLSAVSVTCLVQGRSGSLKGRCASSSAVGLELNMRGSSSVRVTLLTVTVQLFSSSSSPTGTVTPAPEVLVRLPATSVTVPATGSSLGRTRKLSPGVAWPARVMFRRKPSTTGVLKLSAPPLLMAVITPSLSRRSSKFEPPRCVSR